MDRETIERMAETIRPLVETIEIRPDGIRAYSRDGYGIDLRATEARQLWRYVHQCQRIERDVNDQADLYLN